MQCINESILERSELTKCLERIFGSRSGSESNMNRNENHLSTGGWVGVRENGVK